MSAALSLPPLLLPAFEGPLDLLLHLIREHRVDIADIPILQITDQYLAYLRAMEEMNLNIAGEFLLMAATLLEIKSRMLLPKPLCTPEPEDEEDPKLALIRRLEDYGRYKALVATLAEWEEDRRALFFREPDLSGSLYETPGGFGEWNPASLLKALQKLLAEAGDDGGQAVTSVRRQKLTLRLAMAALWRKVQRAGPGGVPFEECFPRPLVRLEIVMTFLALLELLRQGRVKAGQDALLGEIQVFAHEADGYV